MLKNNILRIRYNQLQAIHAVAGNTKQSTRRQLAHRGRSLSVVDLRQVEDNARLNGEGSSESDESKDEVKA